MKGKQTAAAEWQLGEEREEETYDEGKSPLLGEEAGFMNEDKPKFGMPDCKEFTLCVM